VKTEKYFWEESKLEKISCSLKFWGNRGKSETEGNAPLPLGGMDAPAKYSNF